MIEIDSKYISDNNDDINELRLSNGKKIEVEDKILIIQSRTGTGKTTFLNKYL